MLINSTLLIESNSKENNEILYTILLPETKTHLKRSSWNICKKNNKLLQIEINAKDIIAYRATSNLILHIVHLAEQTFQIIEN